MASSTGHRALSSYWSDLMIELIKGKGLKFIECCIALMEILASLFHDIQKLLLSSWKTWDFLHFPLSDAVLHTYKVIFNLARDVFFVVKRFNSRVFISQGDHMAEYLVPSLDHNNIHTLRRDLSNYFSSVSFLYDSDRKLFTSLAALLLMLSHYLFTLSILSLFVCLSLLFVSLCWLNSFSIFFRCYSFYIDVSLPLRIIDVDFLWFYSSW